MLVPSLSQTFYDLNKCFAALHRYISVFSKYVILDIDNYGSHGSSIELEGNSYSDFNDKLLSISYMVFYYR